MDKVFGFIFGLISAEEVGGVVRALTSSIGGGLVTKGIIDSNDVTVLAGAVAALATAVWSIIAKRMKANKNNG